MDRKTLKKDQKLDLEFLKFEEILNSKIQKNDLKEENVTKEKELQKSETKKEELKPIIQTISSKPVYKLDNFIQPVNPLDEKIIPKKFTLEVDETKKRKKIIMEAGGERWEDESLLDWPENDHRIFVGNLGKDVNDNILHQAFSKYKSIAKVKVIREKTTGKTKGYGFVSFLEAEDMIKALEEMDNKFIGSRPCTLKKSKWQERTQESQKKKKKKNHFL